MVPVKGLLNVFVTSSGEVYAPIKGGVPKKRKTTLDKSTGYYVVRIAYKKHYVHRLVASAFVPNLNQLPSVNHKDLDKTNNHPSNLEWCTLGQNNTHAHENGVHDNKLVPIIAVHPVSGEGLYFRSTSEAVRAGFNMGNIQRARNTGIKSSGYNWYALGEVA